MKQSQRIILTRVFFTLLLIILVTGCSSPNPVQLIIILPRPSVGGIPPGGWALNPATSPFPSQIQRIFYPGQEMLIGLKLDKKLKNNITFSKVTLFNKETTNELTILSSDLGPFEPGQTFYLPYYNVPNEQGSYEARIYLDQKVVASAMFEVQSDISADEAIAIASSQIPLDYRSLAKVQAYFDEEQGQNGIWLVNLYGLDITREELEQFGWQEGDNISFGNFSPGTNEYYGVLIYIDGKTGEIISQKAIWVWLGPGPPEVTSS